MIIGYNSNITYKFDNSTVYDVPIEDSSLNIKLDLLNNSSSTIKFNYRVRVIS